MSLATAMAISAAAVAPNMGRSTSQMLVAFMTIINARLGFWAPHPGKLEESRNSERLRKWREYERLAKQETPSPERDAALAKLRQGRGFNFDDVFQQELEEIDRRWSQLESPHHRRQVDFRCSIHPSIKHNLIGLGLSGGGIRSASINLGITQALHQAGVFDLIDYMSTVSGGGYLGSSISTLMRSRTPLASEIAGAATVETEPLVSEIDGDVSIKRTARGQIVSVTGEEQIKNYWFGEDVHLSLDSNTAATGDVLREGVKSEADTANGDAGDLDDDDGKGGDAVAENPLGRFPKGDQVVTVTGGGMRRTYRFASEAALNVKDLDNISAETLLLKPRVALGTSELQGTVRVDDNPREEGGHVVTVQSTLHRDRRRVYCFSRFERLLVSTGDHVEPGQPLIERHNSLGRQFSWRVSIWAFAREVMSRLHENWRWVNLSDGGHLENLATIELLRRRCKLIIIGDCERDPKMQFPGMATLIRTARIDLGIDIDIDLCALRAEKGDPAAQANDGSSVVSQRHWAIGKITYPKHNWSTSEDDEQAADEASGVETGYLLYLKSSFTGDEGEVIQEYRSRNTAFPHQSTADQFFDEGQFEAYRALGEHIGRDVLDALRAAHAAEKEEKRKVEARARQRAKTAKTVKKSPAKPAPAAEEPSEDSTIYFEEFEASIEALWLAEEKRRNEAKANGS